MEFTIIAVEKFDIVRELFVGKLLWGMCERGAGRSI